MRSCHGGIPSNEPGDVVQNETHQRIPRLRCFRPPLLTAHCSIEKTIGRSFSARTEEQQQQRYMNSNVWYGRLVY